MGTTLAFTLGVLSVFFVAAVTILAWGIVGVLKLSKKLTAIERRFDQGIDNLWEDSSKVRDYLDRSIADTHLRMDQRFEHMQRDVQEQFRHCESYTDSRIDRALNGGKKLLKDNIN